MKTIEKAVKINKKTNVTRFSGPDDHFFWLFYIIGEKYGLTISRENGKLRYLRNIKYWY